ncbi:MAG: MATE family efflux transporter [Clostridia bacterium]|nr:MATE family efflux transporter [Clostridia bacterium]
MVRDMTHGSPMKLLFGFWFPLLLGNLFQQVYNLADSVIVGRFVGVDAFAGVSATGSLNFLILGFLLGMCSGCAIPVAQSFGENDPHSMRKYFANAIYLCGGLAAVMSVATVLATRPILRWIGTPEDIMDQAYHYIVYIFGGMIATMVYNLASGVLRAVGNTRTPLYFLILSCAVNVALDLLFVLVFRMGVTGAAVATVAAQLLSGILCMRLIFKKYDVLRIRGEEWRPDAACIRRLSGIGLPMGLQFSITAIGSLIMQTAVNSLGSGAVAAIGAGGKVYTLFCCPFEAMGATIATWCGQNLGARRIDRVRVGVRQSLLVMTCYAVCAVFFVRLCGEGLIGLFITGADASITSDAVKYLRMVVYFFVPLLIIFVLRNALQGLGFSRIAMFAGLFELVGRAFVAFALVGPHGFDGAILANPAAWIMADVLLIPAYLLTVRKLERAGVARLSHSVA